MRYKLLNVEIDAFTLSVMLDFIKQSIDANQKTIIASQNLHSIYYLKNDAEMRKLHQMAYKRIDGMPIVWIGRLLGYPLNNNHRLTWVDLLHPLIKKSEQEGWKVYYLGGDENSVSTGVRRLKEAYPNLIINYRNGFFDTGNMHPQNLDVLNEIKLFAPHLLIVGMGMPRQERWILNNLDNINSPVIMTCGAAIEYVAGTVKTPSRWMGRFGLEWAFRLFENPKRFYYRYLIEPWTLVPLILRDLYKKRILKKDL